MTDEISIKPGLITDHGWEFEVTFFGRRHQVMLNQRYWHKLTRGDISPMDLVRLGIGLANQHRVSNTLPAQFDLEFLTSRVSDFERHIRAEARAEAAANPR